MKAYKLITPEGRFYDAVIGSDRDSLQDAYFARTGSMLTEEEITEDECERIAKDNSRFGLGA